MKKILHSTMGLMTIEECERFLIAAFLEESKRDVVSLAFMVAVTRDEFNLTGQELVNFIQTCILALLENGLLPVRGNRPTRSWLRLFEGESSEKIADAIIDEWVKSGVDPDLESPWFSSPVLLDKVNKN
ncbi:TPA: hypothetical protein N2C61_006463 [Pseudomonas aeruginosa]|uniref:hypothetical protein n=1 Tax=Alcaligenes xylosoxydans xylosoxydans TaxID=85698 RepID=UPI0011875475|nr:hypothetical protein [Achromobacter xylosoxidans]HCL4135298.1 hypothetical protein [Pseudomonas aeruginosa]